MQTTDLTPCAIDQDGGRQAEHSQRVVGSLAARIEVPGEMVQREIAVQPVDGRLSGAIDGYGDQREPIAADFLARRSSDGISTRHGARQVAQKLRRMTRWRRSCSPIVRPSSAVIQNSGSGTGSSV
jgi:hypothetical protein